MRENDLFVRFAISPSGQPYLHMYPTPFASGTELLPCPVSRLSLRGGYKEAVSVCSYDSDAPFHHNVSQSGAFDAYRSDSEFRKPVDSGLFRCVHGCFSADDEEFVNKDDDGAYTLTDHAWYYLPGGTLQYSWQSVRPSPTEKRFPDVILHRANADRKVSNCAGQNSDVIKMFEEPRQKREEF